MFKFVNGVTISLDGQRDTHDASRRTGAFDAAIGAMQALTTIGAPFNISFSIGINTTPEEISTMFEIAGGFHAPVTFQPGQLFVLGAFAPNPNAPTPDSFRSIMRMLIEKKKKEPETILNSFTGLKHLVRWPEDIAIPCGAGYFFAALTRSAMYSLAVTVSPRQTRLEIYCSETSLKYFRAPRATHVCNAGAQIAWKPI